MNRKLRTTLPCISKQNKHLKLEQKLLQQKTKQKSFYDRTAKQLPPLSSNDTVRIEEPGGWKTKATVLQEVAPRSFTVRTEEGQIFRRNRCSLLKTPETVEELSEAQSESESIPLPTTDSQTTHTQHSPSTPVLRKSHSPTPVLRRSTRESKKPDRLIL